MRRLPQCLIDSICRCELCGNGTLVGFINVHKHNSLNIIKKRRSFRQSHCTCSDAERSLLRPWIFLIFWRIKSSTKCWMESFHVIFHTWPRCLANLVHRFVNPLTKMSKTKFIYHANENGPGMCVNCFMKQAKSNPTKDQHQHCRRTAAARFIFGDRGHKMPYLVKWPKCCLPNRTWPLMFFRFFLRCLLFAGALLYTIDLAKMLHFRRNAAPIAT